MLFAVITFGALGLIIGSFLNVLVLRKGVMSLGGRSKCPSCGNGIAWYDNMPVLSWFVLRGRCRSCGSRISFQYPLVEATVAVLFAAIGGWASQFLYDPSTYIQILVYCAIAALLVAIAVYDMLHTIIPDEWSYSFAALALFATFLQGELLPMNSDSLWILLAGPITALPLFMLWLISRGKWMGLGDPKLALGIGWMLGLPLGIVAVFSSFILGSLVLLPLLVFERVVTHTHNPNARASGLTMKSEVPFGPFLIASCLLFWFAKLYGVAIPLYLFGL